MQRKRTAGDITFGTRDHSGIHLEKVTYVPGKNHPLSKNLVFKLQNRGTAFLVHKFKKIIKINNEFALGLLLTAGHCVCDPNKLTPDDTRFQCNDKFEAVFLKSFMADFNYPMMSMTNNNYFVYPGDLALLLLTTKEKSIPKVSSLEIDTAITFGSEITVAGYPVRPENILNCCPNLYGASKEEILREMNAAFHNFSTLVYSDGDLLNNSNELIDINCVGVNGMSGGPVICGGKLVGVYVGGPPLPGQYMLWQINRYVMANDFVSAHASLGNLFATLRYIYSDPTIVYRLKAKLCKCAIIDQVANGKICTNSYQEIEFFIAAESEKILTSFFIKFFTKYLVYTKYKEIIKKHEERIHSMKHNLLKDEDFCSVYYYFCKHLSNYQFIPREMLEIKEMLIVLCIAEHTLLNQRDIPTEIKQDGQYYSALQHLETLKAEFTLIELNTLKDQYADAYVNACYEMVLLYRNPGELKHNVAISVEHQVFHSINRYIAVAGQIGRKGFASAEELCSHILSMVLNKT